MGFFITDALKGIGEGLLHLGKAIGSGRLDKIFAELGGLSNVLALLKSAAASANPYGAGLAVLTNVFQALGGNRNPGTAGATGQFANNVLSTMRSIAGFGL